MDRLTKRKDGGCHVMDCENCRRGDCTALYCRNRLKDRLAVIEDILGDNYDLDRLRELVEADKEGRCVVLSEPMKPMVCIGNESDVFCPNCGKTLSGKWRLSDADDEKKLCQCPNCGQSIDDTNCECVESALKGEAYGG